MRRCARCGEEKDPAAFSVDRRRKDGVNRYCKPCAYRYHQDWYHRKHYGMTLTEREALLVAQGGCCAACSAALTDRGHLDHCHSGGSRRGVVCRGCNLAIGHAENSPTRLRVIADYVEAAQ